MGIAASASYCCRDAMILILTEKHDSSNLAMDTSDTIYVVEIHRLALLLLMKWKRFTLLNTPSHDLAWTLRMQLMLLKYISQSSN